MRVFRASGSAFFNSLEKGFLKLNILNLRSPVLQAMSPFWYFFMALRV